MRHFRSSALHVLDYDYQSLRSLGAGSWPYYVFADAQGNVVFQTVSMGRGFADVPKFEAAFAKALQEKPATKTESGSEGAPAEGMASQAAAPPRPGEVICKDGICTIATAPGAKPPVRELAPKLAAGADGSLWLVFTSNRDGDENVYLRECVPPGAKAPTGVKRIEARRLTRSLADDCAPALAVAPDGRVWVAWASLRSGKYDIFVQSLEGGTFAAETRITESADDAMRPAIAVDGEGRVWVVYVKWNRDFGTSRDRDVFARWFQDGKWCDEFRVSPPEPAIEDHTDPAIAPDPKAKERVWVAWSYDYHPGVVPQNTEDTDQPSVFARPVGPSGPIGDSIHLVGTPGKDLHAVDLWPSLAFDADGVLWCAFDAAFLLQGGRGALLSHFEGEKFTVPERIGWTDAEFESPSLAVAPDGSKLLVWSERLGGRWRIRGARQSQGSWSDPHEIVEGEGDLRNPHVACRAGEFWIAFEERHGFKSTVRVERIGP